MELHHLPFFFQTLHQSDHSFFSTSSNWPTSRTSTQKKQKTIFQTFPSRCWVVLEGGLPHDVHSRGVNLNTCWKKNNIFFWWPSIAATPDQRDLGPKKKGSVLTLAWSLTARPWKMVVGIWTFFWDSLFSGAVWVLGRVVIWLMSSMVRFLNLFRFQWFWWTFVFKCYTKSLLPKVGLEIHLVRRGELLQTRSGSSAQKLGGITDSTWKNKWIFLQWMIQKKYPTKILLQPTESSAKSYIYISYNIHIYIYVPVLTSKIECAPNAPMYGTFTY